MTIGECPDSIEKVDRIADSLGVSAEPLSCGVQTSDLVERTSQGIDPEKLAPGEVHVTKKAVFVGTGTTPVRLGPVQAPGKKPMPATDWARGARLDEGSVLG